MQTAKHRPLIVAALSLFLALPALADPGTIEKELTAHMVRVDRGKRNLDKASRSNVVALKLTSLEKAALSLSRARTALRAKEGIAFEALAEEAESLLVRTYNLTARIHLAREDLTKAKEANALALAVNRDGARAKEMAQTIQQEEEKDAARAEVEVPQEVASIEYVEYAPYYDDYRGLGYTTYVGANYRRPIAYRRCRSSLFGISYRGRNYTAFKSHVGHRHGGTGHATSGTYYRGRRTPTNGYDFRGAGRGAFRGNGRTPKMSFSAGNTFGVFQRNTSRSYGASSSFGGGSRGAGRGAFRGPRTTGWGN